MNHEFWQFSLHFTMRRNNAFLRFRFLVFVFLGADTMFVFFTFFLSLKMTAKIKTPKNQQGYEGWVSGWCYLRSKVVYLLKHLHKILILKAIFTHSKFGQTNILIFQDSVFLQTNIECNFLVHVTITSQ